MKMQANRLPRIAGLYVKLSTVLAAMLLCSCGGGNDQIDAMRGTTGAAVSSPAGTSSAGNARQSGM